MPTQQNSSIGKESEYVSFSVDAQLLRELGERLVGKPYVALGELVKNAYDADATRCVIKFSDDAIEIVDNGTGMTREDFVGKWMRIGSTHKRKEALSPVLKRQLTGSKGVGRLSAQFLGSRIEVETKSAKGGSKAVRATIDWNDSYTKGSLVEAGAWLHDEADARAWLLGVSHGTKIVISGLKDEWIPEMFKDLAAELWLLQPPLPVADDVEKSSQFNVALQGVEGPSITLFENQTKAALENWIAKIEGEITNGRTTGIAKVKVKFRDGELRQASFALPNKSLESARFEVFVFNLAGRQPNGINVKEAREYFQQFGGVHIYDGGFRLPFYGGGEQDWLNIEVAHSHRLIVSKLVPENLKIEKGTLRDLPTLNRVFGLVKVSTARESAAAKNDTPPSRILTMQVTRDRLIDNFAFADLVYFVRWAFDFYSYQSTHKRASEAAKRTSEHPSDDAEVGFESVVEKLEELKEKVPSKLVEPVETALRNFHEAEKSRRLEADAERVLLGALATAGMGSVALQHELAKELATLERMIKELQDEIPEDELSEFSEALGALRGWVKVASQTRRMFSPLFDSEDRDRVKKMRLKRVLDRLASNLKPLLRGIAVETDDIPEDLYLPKGTLAGWNAVFQNIFINAVNATLMSANKRIHCRAFVDAKGMAHLSVADTGVGVSVKTSEKFFRPFVRELELPEDRIELGLGGMGMGLTIVRMVCETFGCNVHFAVPRSPFKTALEITWEDDSNG